MPRERKNAKKDDGEGGPKAKKRRSSAATTAAAAGNPIIPPNYSDNQQTVYASNPFDDFPPPNHRPGPGPPMQGHMMGPGAYGGSGPPGMSSGPVLGGKIYPSDMPRIKNTNNPNAPPIYPCGICRKEVNEQDQAILCESGCNFWYHRACTGLTDFAYSLLTDEIYAEWACDNCMRRMIPLVKCKP